jgi:hypothetical protein
MKLCETDLLIVTNKEIESDKENYEVISPENFLNRRSGLELLLFNFGDIYY